MTAAFLREADRDRIVADAETSLNEDANFYGASQSLSRSLRPALAVRRRHDRLRDALDTAAKKRGKADFAPAVAAGIAVAAGQRRPVADAAARARHPAAARVRHHEAARVRALGVSGLAWAGALAIAFFISRSVTRPLAATARQLTVTAQQVAATASQVSASAQSLAQGATEQAASLEETSASMEEMASMTHRNAEHAAQAATLVTDVARQVEHRTQAFSGMVASMSAIRESSDKVSRIIKTIDEIAFQTNILALNAAVEAAGAGEAGHGLRGRRRRSAHAGTALGAGRQGHRGADRGVDARTGEGAARVRDVARVISSITGSVSQLETLVGDVREASRQQSEGIAQVSQAIVQMEKVTQTTAATAEETAATSAALNAHAETSMVVVGRLASLIERARAAVAGTTAASRAAARAAAGRRAGGTAPKAPRISTATRQARPVRSSLRRAS